MRPLGLLLLFAAPVFAQSPSLDAFGDPLPAGTIARLGATRFRLGGAGNALAFSADGKTIVSGGWHGSLRVWDVATGQELRRIPVREKSVKAVALSPDGKHVAAVGGRGALFVHDLATGQELRAIGWSLSPLLAVAYSPDGKLLASAGGDSVTAIVDLATSKAVHMLKGHRKTITALSFSPDGKVLATSATDNTVRLWDTATGAELFRIRDERMEYDAVRFSSDGVRLLVGGQVSGKLEDEEPDSGDGRLQVWDVAGVAERMKATATTPERMKKLIAELDSRVLTTREDAGRELEALGPLAQEALQKELAGKPSLEMTQRIETLLATMKNGPPLPGHQRHILRTGNGPVGVLTLAPDGATIALGKEDGVHFWNAATGKELGKLAVPAGGVQAAAFTPDGKTLACSVGNSLLLLATRSAGAAPRWEIQNLATAKAQGHVTAIGGLSFAPDGKTVASFAWGEKQIRIWDAGSGKQLRTVGEGINFNAISYAADGKTLSSGADRDDGSRALYVWLTENDRLLRKIDVAGEQWLHGFQFSPDGQTALAVEGAGETVVRRWNLGEGKELARLPWANLGTAPAVFPDGRTLAGGLHGKAAVVIRDADGDGERHRLANLGYEVTRVTATADGKCLATYGESVRRRVGELCIWDAVTGKELHKFDVALGQANALAFSRDGRLIAAAGSEGAIRLWNLGTGELQRTLASPAPVEALTFSADGKRLASAGADCAILVWPLGK